MGRADSRGLARYVNLAGDDAIRAHQTNSPTDWHRRRRAAGGRRMPLRRPSQAN